MHDGDAVVRAAHLLRPSTTRRRLSASIRCPNRTSPGSAIEHEADPLGRPLLVAADRVEDGFGVDPAVERRRQAGPLEQLGDLGLEPFGAGEPERGDEADRDRLAVAVALVAGGRLDPVADGVAEVEHRAQPGSRSSASTTSSFVRAQSKTSGATDLGVDRLERADPLPERPAGDQRRLDDLGEAGGELGCGKGAQAPPGR